MLNALWDAGWAEYSGDELNFMSLSLQLGLGVIQGVARNERYTGADGALLTSAGLELLVAGADEILDK